MRLIDADKALKIAESYGTTHGTSLGRHSGVADTIYDKIAKLPTIEAEPVRHGKWYEGGGSLLPMHKYDEHTNPEAVFFATCSECRVTINCNGVVGGYSYCPHCGAKMNGGCEDENH